MRRTTVWLVSLGAALALVTTPHAALLDYGPVDLTKVDQCQRAEPRSFGPAPQIQSLAMGKPTGLAALSSWVTSDMMADDYSTDAMWYDFEQIRVMGMFYSPRDRALRAAIRITDMNNDVVESGVAQFSPDPASVMYVSLDVGELAPGFYKAKVTYKQGNRAAGSEYWFTVAPSR